jgi:DNA-binding response OmpR family regulator
LGELVARVKAHLSRYDRLLSENNRNLPKDEIRIRGIRIDKLARKVYVNGEEIALTSKEYDLLLFLATHPNWVFSKNELFEKIWGLDSLGDIATVTVHVSKLREKIEADPSKPQYIETVWGVGYRFQL